MTDWKPAMRVPDPAVRVLDERFRPYVLPLAKLERLAAGCRWAEGPVWFGDHRTLVPGTISRLELVPRQFHFALQ